MSIDLSTLSPKARTSYLVLGRHFSSTDTLAQANQTLQGLSNHGAELVSHGFAASDGARLLGAREGLVAAGAGRNEARGDRKITSATFVAAMKAGRAARKSSRSVLMGARRALHEQDDPAAEAGVKKVDAVLAQTRNAGDDAGRLADQLDMLRSALGEATVTVAAAERGGELAAAELLERASALRTAAATRAGAAGTPAETEHLDLLDGIVVTLARNAWQAARAAARRLGKPALAADFELTKLYGSRSGATAAKAAPVAPPLPANDVAATVTRPFPAVQPAPANGAAASNAMPSAS